MTLKTELYPHQINAAEKLSHVKVGALYMEMGTGKTRTALELVFQRLQANKIERVLWLCPCTTIKTIEKEIERHACDCDDVFKVCGIQSLSNSVRINFELLNFVQVYSVMLIVDESILIKNHMANRSQNIERLAKYCKYKLILNGTPVSRNEADLFNQWYILDWRILGYRSYWSFAANHIEYDDDGRIRKCLNTEYLAKKISPYTYQVRKNECLNLQEKTYDVYFTSLSCEQEEAYSDVIYNLLEKIEEPSDIDIYKLFTACQRVVAGKKIVRYSKIETKDIFSSPLKNPRIQLLLDIMLDIPNEEKVIIWCKYNDEISDIQYAIKEYFSEDSCILNGSLSQKDKEKNLASFESRTRFLIGNPTAGGFGLNLQFCSYMIYYSSTFDYAVRMQSEDRIHRIGQSKNVHIIDICADKTIDLKIRSCLSKKENLVDDIKHNIAKIKDKKTIIKILKGEISDV